MLLAWLFLGMIGLGVLGCYLFWCYQFGCYQCCVFLGVISLCVVGCYCSHFLFMSSQKLQIVGCFVQHFCTAADGLQHMRANKCYFNPPRAPLYVFYFFAPKVVCMLSCDTFSVCPCHAGKQPVFVHRVIFCGCMLC